MVSIRIIRGINRMGVPLGTRCLIFFFQLDIMPISCILIHKGRERLRVILRCEVGAKV